MGIDAFAIFSLHQGALWAIVFACAIDAAINGFKSSRDAAAYLALTAVVAAGISGWGEYLFLQKPNTPVAWQWWAVWVPLTGIVGVLGARNWLGTRWRSTVHDRFLLGFASTNGAVMALGLAAWLRIGMGEQLADPGALELLAQLAFFLGPVAATSALLMVGGVAYATWRRGHSTAAWVFWSSLLTAQGLALLAIGRVAQLEWPVAVLSFTAALHIVGSGCIGFGAGLRGRANMRGQVMSNGNDLTGHFEQLPSGSNLEHAMHQLAQSLGSHPACVLVVTLFNHRQLGVTHGRLAVRQLMNTALFRIHGGVTESDLVGRLGVDCFVVMPARLLDAAQLRYLSLTLAASLRRDMTLNGRAVPSGGSPIVRVDAAVGLCWSAQVSSTHIALDQAKLACLEARNVPCLAAIRTIPHKPALAVDLALPAFTHRP